MGAAIRLSPCPADGPVRFARGQRSPRAIAWFGFSAFWGHLRHLLASAIATENIDSRQWMQPDDPAELLGRLTAVLRERGAREAATLVEAFGGEAWLDFVADTGDDVSVSGAVAKLLAAEYEAPDPDDPESMLRLPRGHVLIHGGDFAYPVATVREMSRRLLDPWNHVLEGSSDARPRVILGVAGNHDWYDGLDGFARLCQLPSDFEAPMRPSRATFHPETNEHPVLAWAEAFSRDEAVRKPGQLGLFGYVSVQRCSYFRLPISKGLDLLGVDRQLNTVDPRQKAFFASRESRARIVVLPDPARAWGEVRPHGAQSLASLGIVPKRDACYILTGDIHHYERSKEGVSLHVVAGGGGAFLQGARMAEGGLYRRIKEFPGPKASAALLMGLPWHVATGGAGWLLWLYLGILQAIELLVHMRFGTDYSVPLAVAHSAIVATATALLVGWRRHRMELVVPFAIAIGLFIGALPLGLSIGADKLGIALTGNDRADRLVVAAVSWLLATFVSGGAFGTMLILIARLGLNHAQPFAALGLPCFKHFVRMRVRDVEGSPVIDTFVIGLVDPVGGSPPVLVDSFRWKP